MERQIRKKVSLLGILCLIVIRIYSQNLQKQESLVTVINKLKTTYNIQFNYAEDIVEGIFIVPPKKTLLLPDVLAYLEYKTGLSFSMFNQDIILIKLKDGKTLCGFVMDKESLKPIPFASVKVANNTTITDKRGFFQIEIKNITQPVSISHMGHKTLEQLYNQFELDVCGYVYLPADYQALSEVVVSNYITTGINKIDDGAFEIDFSRFDILPGVVDNDVLQSIQAFPGILSVNETVSNINIRGGTHDQNLILWDGIKMYQSGHFFGLISMYNPQITQRVLLRKGGGDVSYTDGVSGVITMETEREVNTKLKGTLGVNLIDANAFVDVPVSHASSVQVAVRKSINGLVETPTYTSFFNRIAQNTEIANNSNSIVNTDELFSFYDTSLRWIYKISNKDELRLNFINAHNELQFNENAVVNDVNESRESRLTQNSIAGALHYKRLWTDKIETSLELYETDYKLRAINANILKSQRYLQENVVSETSIKQQIVYKFHDRLKLSGGYHFVETGITNLDDVDFPEYRLLVSEVLRTHGIFSKVKYVSKDGNAHVNLGLRYNYITKLKKELLEPRLSFSQRFLNHFTFEVLGAYKHQNTSQVIHFQNDFLGIEKRRWQLSNNDDIPILTSKQASVGLNYNNKGWLFSVEGYIKEVNGITSQSQGFQNKYEFTRSQGSYEVNGLDVLFRKQIDKFNTWVNYAYMDNTYFFEALETNAFSSNFNITHVLTVGTAYSTSNFKVSAGLNWHSGKPVTKPVKGDEIIGDVINFGGTNQNALDEYLRLDCSAFYDFKLSKTSNASIGLSIWNVLNKVNEINSFDRLDYFNETINETTQRSLGFTPNAFFKVSF